MLIDPSFGTKAEKLGLVFVAASSLKVRFLCLNVTKMRRFSDSGHFLKTSHWPAGVAHLWHWCSSETRNKTFYSPKAVNPEFSELLRNGCGASFRIKHLVEQQEKIILTQKILVQFFLQRVASVLSETDFNKTVDLFYTQNVQGPIYFVASERRVLCCSINLQHDPDAKT